MSDSLSLHDGIPQRIVTGAPESAFYDTAELEHVKVGTVTSFGSEGVVIYPSEVKGKSAKSSTQDSALKIRTSKYVDWEPPNDIVSKGHQVMKLSST